MACINLGFGIDGSIDFQCELFTARPDAVLTVTLLSDGVVGQTPPTSVDNGALASVVVDAVDASQSREIPAGDTVFITLFGQDAFGNAYLVQTDPTLDLDDTSGTLSQGNAVLGADGRAEVQGSITLAGETVITASQADQVLGTSAAVTIIPADHATLDVVLAEPWAWQGLPVEVRTQSVDAFGNRTDWSGIATVSSRNTASPSVDVTLTNGVGVEVFTWSEVSLNEVLEATTPTALAGEGAPLYVVQDCGVIGPTASLEFGGYPEAIACFDPVSETGLISASFAGSIAGGTPLVGFAMASGGAAVLSAVDSIPYTLHDTGAHRLRGLVAQTDGCGDEIEATAWVGLDDGAPVGPVSLVPADLSLDAGTGITAIDILGVMDCSRDPSSNGAIRVRTTRGVLSGAVPSGAGLEATLDINGEGTVTLDVTGVETGGLAEIHAWSASGAALGRADVDVVGDNRRPVVWSQDPSGETLTMVSEVRIVFSEPMLAGQLEPSNFACTGPSPALVDSVASAAGDTEAVLTLAAPVDGAAGTWTVTVADDVRDAAGNRLDGTWSGNASAFVGSFGAVVDSGDVVSCAPILPEGGWFRPNGDDGVGGESDVVTVDITTAVAPAWWVLSVTDRQTGVLLRRDYLVPSGAFDTMTWDGRDATGGIVDNGDYEIRVEPEDGLGNRGAGCTVVAWIDNVVGEAP